MTVTDRINGVLSGVAIKVPCRVATTANINLSGLQTIDGLPLVEGDRVLVKNQADPKANGIYNVAAGAWTRAIDFNGRYDVVQGTQVLVVAGTVAAGMTWEVTTASPVIGATAIVWARLGLTSSSNLPGWYLITDYGGDPTGVNDASLSIQAAHDAMPAAGGTIYMPAGTAWSCRSAVVISKSCVLLGAGRGVTILNVGSTFAHTAGVLFKVTAAKVQIRDFQVLGDITDPTLSYIAIQFDGPAAFTTNDIFIDGCGVGFDYVQGNTGEGYNDTVRHFSIAGKRFGGTANKFSSEYRFYGGVITNPNSTDVTNGTTASGRVINMANTVPVTVGMGFASFNIPAGAKVVSKTSSTVTIDADVVGTVLTGHYVRYGLWLDGACLYVRNNTFDVNFTDVLAAGGRYLLRVEGDPNIGAGLFRADTLWFNNFNATASTYFGAYIIAGTNFRFNDSWLGDVPFGSVVYASAHTNVATDVTDIHFNNSMVGGGGQEGIKIDYAKNIFLNNAEVVGNGQLTSNTYDAVSCSANARGKFEMLSGHAGIDLVDNQLGASRYGLFLAIGSFAGAGDAVDVSAKLTGLTKGWSDGSSPGYPLKTFNPFGSSGSPAFRIGKTTTQVIGAAAGWVKVVFPAVQFDYGGYTTSSSFKPPSGTYQINAAISFGTDHTFKAAIYKNGVAQSTQSYTTQTTGFCADRVISDGNDVFEVYVNIPAGGTIDVGQDVTYFSGG